MKTKESGNVLLLRMSDVDHTDCFIIFLIKCNSFGQHVFSFFYTFSMNKNAIKIY